MCGDHSFYQAESAEFESEGEEGVMMRSSEVGECGV